MYQPKWRQWTPLAHTSDGFWTFGTDPVERPVVAPFRIRLTAANGQRIVDTVPELGKSYHRSRIIDEFQDSFPYSIINELMCFLFKTYQNHMI